MKDAEQWIEDYGGESPRFPIRDSGDARKLVENIQSDVVLSLATSLASDMRMNGKLMPIKNQSSENDSSSKNYYKGLAEAWEAAAKMVDDLAEKVL